MTQQESVRIKIILKTRASKTHKLYFVHSMSSQKNAIHYDCMQGILFLFCLFVFSFLFYSLKN